VVVLLFGDSESGIGAVGLRLSESVSDDLPRLSFVIDANSSGIDEALPKVVALVTGVEDPPSKDAIV
jgi:hypothetical protein